MNGNIKEFTWLSEVISLRKVKTKIALTDRMDLILKESIPELESTVKSFQDDEQRKWIAIRSDSGFEHFKGNQINTSNDQ